MQYQAELKEEPYRLFKLNADTTFSLNALRRYRLRTRYIINWGKINTLTQRQCNHRLFVQKDNMHHRRMILESDHTGQNLYRCLALWMRTRSRGVLALSSSKVD